jgi:hypothetical protein
MTLDDIEATLLILIEQCGPLGMPEQELEELRSLTRAREPGVALENLCVQLYEHDIAVPRDIAGTAETLAREMELREFYWLLLARRRSDVERERS